jgi:uncharacterized FlgJ-related protein
MELQETKNADQSCNQERFEWPRYSRRSLVVPVSVVRGMALVEAATCVPLRVYGPSETQKDK